MSEAAPTGRLATNNLAWPLTRFAVPRMVAPLLNCTGPVAEEGVAVSVSVTVPPYADGFGVEVSTVDVIITTVWTIVAELPGK